MAPDPQGTAQFAGPSGRVDPGLPLPVEQPVSRRAAPLVSPKQSAATADSPRPAGRTVRRGRRVKRIIRRVELWSVLKLSLIFYACGYIVTMAALVVLWGFAYSTGLVSNFESFANDVGFEHWKFYGQHMFHEAAIIGGILVVAATLLTVLAAALLNVISEMTGGIRIVMIEEETTFVPDDPDEQSSFDDGTTTRSNGRRRRR